MYTVIHMQDPGSVRVNQDHGSLASRVGSRVSVADPVPSLHWCMINCGLYTVGHTLLAFIVTYWNSVSVEMMRIMMMTMLMTYLHSVTFSGVRSKKDIR